MSLERVPCRTEVMGWSPQQLADYLKTMSVPGCDKVVLKNSINGSRFVNLSDNDLQKFPKLHAPMISRIQTDISKNQGRRRIFGIKVPKFQEPEPNAEGGWGEDEFDEDFDEDYESPYSDDDEQSGGDYESPNEDAPYPDYEPPPSEPTENHRLCPSQPMGNDIYIDNQVSTRGPPPAVCARPPVSSLPAPVARPPGEPSSRRDSSPHVARRPTEKFPPEPPKVFRNNKPGRDSRSNSSPIRGPQSSTPDRTSSQSWRSQPDGSDPPSWSKPPALQPPASAPVSRSSSSARASTSRFEGQKEQQQTAEKYLKNNTFPFNKGLPPRPGIPGAPAAPSDSLPPANPVSHKPNLAEHRSSIGGLDRHSFRPPPPLTASSSQELDPRWYVGKMTRGQAEGCLRRVNKDGAYLVRDSTRQQKNQPFTLMVLYQDKVYNIQIRLQDQQYQLGTGLKSQECFLSVGDIISHYSQSTLVLIDAKNRSSTQQNQCLLSEPAGSYMKTQTWS